MNSAEIRLLQEAYLRHAKQFSEIIPLELLDKEISKHSKDSMAAILPSAFEDRNLKFRIELLMMPSWASKSKPYRIFQDMYTHIRIKRPLTTPKI